jgi:hypothetical protein
MSIYSSTAPPGRQSQFTSAYGSAGWSAGNGNIYTSLAPGGGSSWAIWTFQVPSATPGETVSYIRIAGSHSFSVSGGSARQCTGRVRFDHSNNGFLNQGSSDLLGAIAGSGASIGVNGTFSPAGFTATDLINGTLMIGMCGSTDAADSAKGAGTYYNACLDFTVYTGSDVPAPPVNSPGGYFQTTASNSNPGVLPGGQFGNTRAVWTGPNSAFMTYWWSILGVPGNTITFAATGTTTRRVDKSMSGNPADWKYSDSGALNCGTATVPGEFTLRCQLSHQLPGADIYLNTPLVVPFLGYGAVWGLP